MGTGKQYDEEFKKQAIKLAKKSKKGATIKGLKKGTAKISVQMKNGKKKVKKTITVKVSSAKKVVVTAEPAKTTNKPTNGSTNGPTKEPVKEPTATPTATSTTEPSVTPTATPTATPTEEPSAEPTATPTPMPLPDLGKNDVKVDLTKENEYGQNSVLEDTITYYEGNGVSYTSTGQASGGGVAYWTNADKSGIDLSKYKSIRIVASSDTANTPVVCELLKSNPANVWGGGIDVFDGYSEYSAITEAGKAQVFEFQISDDLAAALAEGTLAYGIRLKYNAYHTDGEDLPNCNFNIYSIILMGKDDVPEPTATPTAEPTPTPGVASGSAAVVVTATGSAAGLDLEEGDTLDLNASVSTTGCAVTGDIAWTSSNEEVATVSASGTSATVTAVGEGTATIATSVFGAPPLTALVPMAKIAIIVGLALVESAIDIADLSAGKAVPLYKSSSTWVAKPGSMAGELINKTATIVAGKGEEAIDKGTGLLNEWLSKTSGNLTKGIEKNGDKFSKAVGAIVQDNVDNYVGQVVDQLVSICTNAVSQENSVEYVKEKLKQWSDATDFGSEATNKIKEQAVQYIIAQCDSKINELIEKMKEGGDTAKEAVSSLINQLNDNIEKVVASAKGTATNMTNELTEKLKKSASKGAEKMKETLKKEIEGKFGSSVSGETSASDGVTGSLLSWKYSDYLRMFSEIS